MYTGTVLGGPHDGEIFHCKYPDLLLYALPAYPLELYTPVSKDEIPTYDPTPPIQRYRYQNDDDMRGWWVLQK